jgi:hypothetical protein
LGVGATGFAQSIQAPRCQQNSRSARHFEWTATLASACCTAWCHSREALRCFAVERIRAAEPLPDPAQNIDDTTLDAHFAPGYGIFAGPAQAVAELREAVAERLRQAMAQYR